MLPMLVVFLMMASVIVVPLVLSGPAPGAAHRPCVELLGGEGHRSSSRCWLGRVMERRSRPPGHARGGGG